MQVETADAVGYFWPPGEEVNKLAGQLTIDTAGKVRAEVYVLNPSGVGKFSEHSVLQVLYYPQ